MADQINLFRTISCPWCHMESEFLKANKIKFKEVFVDKDQNAARKMIELSGQTGVPVTVIGDDIIIGFDKPNLISTLKKHKLWKTK